MATLTEIKSGELSAQALLDQLDEDTTLLTLATNGLVKASGEQAKRRIEAVYEQLSEKVGENLDPSEVFA